MDLNSSDSSVAHTLIEVHRESSKTLAVRASLQFTKFYLANLLFGQLLKDMRASNNCQILLDKSCFANFLKKK